MQVKKTAYITKNWNSFIEYGVDPYAKYFEILTEAICENSYFEDMANHYKDLIGLWVLKNDSKYLEGADFSELALSDRYKNEFSSPHPYEDWDHFFNNITDKHNEII